MSSTNKTGDIEQNKPKRVKKKYNEVQSYTTAKGKGLYIEPNCKIQIFETSPNNYILIFGEYLTITMNKKIASELGNQLYNLGL